MKHLAIAVSILLFAASVAAEQRYNPFSGEWETVRPGGNETLRYNPYEQDQRKAWSYQEPGSQPTYNPYENRWDMAPPPRQDPRYDESDPYGSRINPWDD